MSQVDHSGYLHKLGGKFVKHNQLRYFELRGPFLYYFKSKPPEEGVPQPLGCIPLHDTRCTDHPKEKTSWSIAGPALPKVYVLSAPNDAEKRRWIDAITAASTIRGGTAPLHAPGTGADASDEDEEQLLYSTNAPPAPPAGSGSAGTFATPSKKLTTQDFELVSVVGKGSFGKVLQVRKRDTGQLFAMKEMDKSIIERENLVEQIFAEKHILQTLRHPFIVTLHYAFQTRDRLYLVLDFLSGGELFFHLSKVGVFEESRAKFYVAQIGLAIGHLHSLDIVYRDLKPENIVLDGDGNVCLTDFGLAKANVREANAQTFCGTPEYLAPEFLLGTGHGKAVDWWSLGVLLYEMVYGLPPFYSENVNEMWELILQKPLEFPTGPDAPPSSPAVEDLLRRLLERDPHGRLQNVDVFRAHPFFDGLDWTALAEKKIPPPFRPDANPLKNFDAEFTQQTARLADGDGGTSHATVSGFTYQGPSPLSS